MSFNSPVWRICLSLFVVSTIQAITEAHPLTSDSDCIIDVKKDLGEPQPLLLDSRTDEFLYPETSDGEIEFSRGETVKLYCTEGFRSTFRGKKSITATCVAGKQFKVDTKIVDISKIVCTDSPKHIARRTNNTCTAGRIIEIGFQIQNDANEKDEKWLQVMRVCHNETIASTNWVQYKQQPSNRGYQHSGKAIRFVQGDFYEGLLVDKLYTRTYQMDSCTTILESKQLCADLMPSGGDFFLTRGHLAARSDFIYRPQQRASYNFLNVAPQWLTFNGGNWAILEENLKSHIDQRNLNADIYTGTYGLLQFDDINGNLRDMYLSPKMKTKLARIPVPKIYYKIVVTDDNAGIVFIGVNNPFADANEIKRNYIYCDNVISNVKYIPWKNILRMGYMYACAVDDFRKFVPTAPNLPKINRILM